MMRWWPVREVPQEAEDPYKRISIRGITWLPTKWRALFVWRFFWPLVIITVNNGNEGTPYRVYFRSGKCTMRSWWRIRANRVAVRLGPGDVTFFFEGPDGLFGGRQVGGPLSRKQVREQYPHAKLI